MKSPTRAICRTTQIRAATTFSLQLLLHKSRFKPPSIFHTKMPPPQNSPKRQTNPCCADTDIRPHSFPNHPIASSHFPLLQSQSRKRAYSRGQVPSTKEHFPTPAPNLTIMVFYEGLRCLLHLHSLFQFPKIENVTWETASDEKVALQGI
jgi:hypothetical protein